MPHISRTYWRNLYAVTNITENAWPELLDDCTSGMFLEKLGIPRDRILLNLQEGAEEIDSFVDVDGSLLMFELKDSEFSMGHAYP